MKSSPPEWERQPNQTQISPKQNVLYIASLPHSGSTLTGLLLGQQPAMAGLGSIEKGVRTVSEQATQISETFCSCGFPIRDCEYWSQILDKTDTARNANMHERYILAINAFNNIFGSDAWAVDSSKLVDPIVAIAKFPEVNLRALHLCRDFRSSIVSTVDLKRSRKGVKRPGWVVGLDAALRWQRRNSSIRRMLVENEIPFLGIGYEEICLGLPRFIEKLGSFLATKMVDSPATIAGSKSHLITGNAMRRQKEKENLHYDYRWFSRTDWIPASLLMPWLNEYNRRWVYSNGFSGIFGSEKGNKWIDP